MSVKAINGIEQSLVDLANGDYQVTTVPAPRRRSNPAFLNAVCIVKNDPALTFGKVYRVKVLGTGHILVKDDNGESVICDSTDFQLSF